VVLLILFVNYWLLELKVCYRVLLIYFIYYFLAIYFKVNASDKFGNTALTWAARKGLQTIVEDLLAAGAEVDSIGMQCTIHGYHTFEDHMGCT
jgi:ankyrin repeat protein